LRDALNGQRLATLFRTQPGDPLLQSSTNLLHDLGPWRGRTLQVAFVVEDSLGCLNVSVDDVSLRLDSPANVEFEVYLGLTNQLGVAQRVAITTNNFWAVTNQLAANTVYYWQIIARRGQEVSASALGQFTTAGAAPLPAIAVSAPANYSSITIPSNLLLTASATAPAGVVKVSYFDGATKIGEASSPPYAVHYLLGAAGLRQVRAVLLDAAGVETVSPTLHLIAVPAGDRSLTLVPPGATWRYLDDGSNQGAAWRQWDFDDRAWKSGEGRFGYGLGGENTLLDFGPDPDDKHITTYFRYAFTNDADLSSLSLRLICDDGVIIWFNDLPIRINLPALSVISYNDRASSEVTGPDQTNFVSYALHPWLLPRGPMLLSVELHQYAHNGPDLAFDLALEATGNFRPLVSLTSPAPSAVLPAAQPITLAAHAFDRYGQIVRVDFLVNGQLAGSATHPPFTLSWSNAPAGLHQLVARATDNDGAATDSTPVWITVGAPQFLAPALDPEGLLLAWPDAQGEFLLEMATRLNPADWQTVTNTSQSTNGFQRLTLPLHGPQQFFRLRSR